MAVALFIITTAGILVLQGSFFSLFWPLQYQPDIMLVLIVSLSILLGEKRGSLVGLAAGLLQDIFFGPALGLFALTRASTGYLTGLITKEIYKDQMTGPLVLTVLMTVFSEFLMFILIHQFFYLNPSWEIFSSSLLVKTIGNVAFLFMIYPVIYNIGKKRTILPRDVRL